MSSLTLPRFPWLQVARSYCDWCTEDLVNGVAANLSKAITFMLKGVGLGPGYAWCAAFVHHCGFYALIDLVTDKSAWPLPATGGCQPLGEFGQKKGALHQTPQVGDVFLLYRAGPGFNRFAHTGFVIEVRPDGSYRTIEGNTNEAGSREGIKVMVRLRRPKPQDRFLRVADLVTTPG